MGNIRDHVSCTVKYGDLQKIFLYYDGAGHQKEATAPPERFKDLEDHSGTLLTQNLLIEKP